MPTEGFEECKLYFEDENGELKELGIAKDVEVNIEEDQELKEFAKELESDGSLEFEIKDKESIRKIKMLMKTDKDKKEERRYNKESFRKFIKGSKRKWM